MRPTDDYSELFAQVDVESDVYFRSGRPWFDVRAFGAAGDGVTDDTDAILEAIATAKGGTGAQGGTVYVPKGTYLVSDTVTVPLKVALEGTGRGASLLSADAANFPEDTPVVVLGDSTGSPPYAGGARIQDIGVLCNEVVGSIGIYTEQAQEAGGVFRCQVIGFGDRGIAITGGGGVQAQNFVLYDVQVTGGSLQDITNLDYPFASCYDLASTGGEILLLRCTGATTTAISPPTRSFYMRTGAVTMVASHAEGAVDGISVLQGALKVFGFTGHTNITNQIHVDAGFTGSLGLYGVRANGSSANPLILDDSNGNTVPATQGCPLYLIGGGGTAGSTKTVLTTEPSVWNRWNVPSRFLAALAVARPAVAYTGTPIAVDGTTDCVVPVTAASAGTNPRLVNLPKATTRGQVIMVKNTDAGTNDISVIPDATIPDTIDGAASFTVAGGVGRHAVILVANGATRWDVFGSY